VGLNLCFYCSYATKKKRYAMLDTLLAAEADNKIDAVGVREEVDTFMFGGHDTTSSSLTFALFLLATHTEVQENVHKEIISMLGDRDINDLQVTDIVEMKYFDRVLKECLRVYAPVTFISRTLTEDWATGG
jgi:cytochrome P450 family 4